MNRIIPIIIGLLFSSFGSTISAQTIEKLQPKDDRRQKDFRLPFRQRFDKDKTDLLKQKPPVDFGLESQSLESAVDPDAYIVGPGDQFLITIWSALENSIPAAVTPEGKLIIPTVGTLFVDGLSLSEVQRMVEQAAAKKYLNSTVSADLAVVRSIRVHVTGQVLNPGPYSALAVHRVSDIIEEAGGLTAWAFERGIEVRHLDGTTDMVDLHRYRKLGNLQANIFLRGGDIVHVPSIDLNAATVRVEGAINDPGTYQLAQNETLTDFLLRVDALSRRTDLNSAYIERKSDNNGHTEIVPVFPHLINSSNGHSDLVLQDGDVVMVPQRQEDVYVIGAVQQPGPYPYIPKLKVQDYVGFAGSTFQAAGLSKSKVIRRNSKKQERGKDLLVGPGDTIFVPRKLEFGIREITLITAQISSLLIALTAVGIIK